MPLGPIGQPVGTWTQSLAPVVVNPTSTPVVLPDDAGPQPLRVLHLINGERFAGAERVQSHLGRCLPHFRISADFVCLKRGEFADHEAKQGGSPARCYDAAMKHRMDLSIVWRIRKLLRRQRYPLMHAHTPRTAMIADLVSRISGVPWVYHVHSPASRDSLRHWCNLCSSLVERIALRSCSHVIAVSRSLRDDCLRSGIDEQAITVVHNGVPKIRPERTRRPGEDDTWVFGMIALMRPRKGLEIALRSLATLSNKHNVQMRLIGDFETEAYRRLIEVEIDRLGIRNRVQHTGFADDVPSALAELDAVLLPSLCGEGLPMVVLEAMAAGVPVIATRVEGTPEAITDGVEGWLAEPGCPASFTAMMRQLIERRVDWERMSAAAAERHREQFSDLAMAEKTACVYRKVLHGRIRSPSGTA